MNTPPFTILVVEDDFDHVLLIKRAFQREESTPMNLMVVGDGQRALNYLNNHAEFREPSSAPRPDLIMLDIKLPKVSGIEVLRHVKVDEALKTIPVVMFTSSKDDEDIIESYEAGANSYITKPESFSGFLQVVQMLVTYWLKTTKLPS